MRETLLCVHFTKMFIEPMFSLSTQIQTCWCVLTQSQWMNILLYKCIKSQTNRWKVFIQGHIHQTNMGLYDPLVVRIICCFLISYTLLGEVSLLNLNFLWKTECWIECQKFGAFVRKRFTNRQLCTWIHQCVLCLAALKAHSSLS